MALRCKKEDDTDMLPMQVEDLKNIRNSLGKECNQASYEVGIYRNYERNNNFACT